MASFNYTTQDGDRLDTLAVKYYGGLHGIQIIVDANPAVPVTAIYPTGTILIIPFVEQSDFEDTSTLPPWKQ